ncbi:MAG: type II toxin-antitoxin system VapC family toxin [Terriglobales bacterium]
MTTCVVDACVAAKWVLPAAGDELLDQANRLIERHVKRDLQLLAPALIEAEIGNVLWKAVRRKRISSADAETSLQRFSELGIEIVPTSGLIERSLQITISCDRSFYDSLYVALALATKTDLVTADERLVNALGSRFPVRWLGAF